MKPFWPRTLQLFPVHLQAQDAHVEDLLALRVRQMWHAPYGVRRMILDDAALAHGEIVFRRLSAIFPSGVTYDSEVPLRRDASAALVGTLSTVGLFLGLPRLVSRGPNVGEQDGVHRSLRYLAQGERDAPWMMPQPELLFQHEDLERFELLSLGRLERVGSGLHLDKTAFATVVRVRAAKELEAALKRLVAGLGKRRTELIRYRADHPLNLESVAYSELPGLQLLAVLQRHLPLLASLSARRFAHPRELYEAMVALHGELVPFGAEELPAYAHDRLGEVFPVLFERIQTIVDEAARDRTTVLAFTRAGDTAFRLSFKREDLVGKRPFLVATSMDETFLRERVPNLLKMASPTGLQPLLQSALRGVAIAVEFEPPAVIPRRNDVVAYRINVRDPLWLDIEDRMQIELHLPHAPKDLELRLYGVERTV